MYQKNAHLYKKHYTAISLYFQPQSRPHLTAPTKNVYKKTVDIPQRSDIKNPYINKSLSIFNFEQKNNDDHFLQAIVIMWSG